MLNLFRRPSKKIADNPECILANDNKKYTCISVRNYQNVRTHKLDEEGTLQFAFDKENGDYIYYLTISPDNYTIVQAISGDGESITLHNLTDQFGSIESIIRYFLNLKQIIKQANPKTHFTLYTRSPDTKDLESIKNCITLRNHQDEDIKLDFYFDTKKNKYIVYYTKSGNDPIDSITNENSTDENENSTDENENSTDENIIIVRAISFDIGEPVIDFNALTSEDDVKYSIDYFGEKKTEIKKANPRTHIKLYTGTIKLYTRTPTEPEADPEAEPKPEPEAEPEQAAAPEPKPKPEPIGGRVRVRRFINNLTNRRKSINRRKFINRRKSKKAKKTKKKTMRYKEK